MLGADDVLPSKGAVNRAGHLLANALIPRGQKVAGPELLEFWKGHFDGEGALLDAAATVRMWRDSHATALEQASQDLGLRCAVSVSQRLKKFSTIVQKLQRFEQMDLTRMEDIAGCRIIAPDPEQAMVFVDEIGKGWEVRRFRDYADRPKEDGYRARHFTVVQDGRSVEIQVRTPLQDLWANVVERDGRQHDVGLKFGDGDETLRSAYRRMAELLAAEERGESSSDDLDDLRRSFGTDHGLG